MNSPLVYRLRTLGPISNDAHRVNLFLSLREDCVARGSLSFNLTIVDQFTTKIVIKIYVISLDKA